MLLIFMEAIPFRLLQNKTMIFQSNKTYTCTLL
jgi:hypothetical protein